MKEKENSAAYFFKQRGKTTITKGTEAAANDQRCLSVVKEKKLQRLQTPVLFITMEQPSSNAEDSFPSTSCDQ